MKSKCLVFLMLLSVLASAQEYEQFFEEFDVVLHQLQVNVLDRDGLPVRGLTKEDFRVLLDGKLQNLEGIQEIELERQVMMGDEGQKIPEQARRLFAFLFDLRYSTKKGVLEAQEAARDFIQSDMLPTDLVGIFTYSQLEGVSLATNFTNDVTHLLNAVDTLGLSKAKNVLPGPAGYYLNSLVDDVKGLQDFNQDTNITSTQTGVSGASGTFASEHVDEMMRLAQNSEKGNYEREVLAFLTSMEKFGDGLRYIRGRKNLIWFSTGFDSSSLTGASADKLKEYADFAAFGLLERVPTDQLGRGDVQSTARRVVESLQASGTVVFSVDTSRIDSFANEKNGLQTLNFFSVDTGGKVFQNRNDYGSAIDEVQHITNHYYMLSFYPETNAKRKREVGKVKVKTPNHPRAKVFTTKGLLLDPNFENMTPIEKDIHIAEYIARDQVVRALPINVTHMQMPMSEKLAKLSVSVDLRGDYFVAPGLKTKQDREVEVFALALEKNSNRVFDQSYFKFKVDTRHLSNVLEETGVKYFSNLFVKPGEYKLKVVARDLSNGKIGSFIEYVKVEELHSDVSGPIVLSDDRWVMVRQPESMARRERADSLDFSYPFQVGEELLVPSAHPVVDKNGQARFFYVLNYRESRGNQKTPSVQAMFMDKDDQYVMIPPEALKADIELRNDEPHLTHLVLTVDMSKIELEDGETYKLMAYFGLSDQRGLRSMSEITVAGL